jgi:repressor LexA
VIVLIGKNIKRLRRGRGYSQELLARKLNVTQGAVSHWEKGTTTPDTAQLLALSRVFDVSLDAFTDDSPLRDLDGLTPIRRNAVPIIGSIACGERVTPDTDPEGYTDIPEGVHADFALRCKGDSMIPTIQDGDLVLIRQQPEVEPGQIAAVNVNGETTLKHVYPQRDGLLLTADNANFPPIFVPNNQDGEIIIHGLAVGYTRLFD